VTHIDTDRQQWQGRQRERARFAEVLEDAADVLERQGELPDAVRWLPEGSSRLAAGAGYRAGIGWLAKNSSPGSYAALILRNRR
jgi:hypothetical protein